MKPQDEQLRPSGDDELLRVVEALIFAAEEPVGADEIVAVVRDVTGQNELQEETVAEAVSELNARYESHGQALRIERWAGGFRMATIRDVAPFLSAYFQHGREKRLSRSLLETLAIIAYKQPVTRPEIDFIRGVSSDYAVRKLMELGLVDVVGRSDAVGRPLLHGTTPHFLEQFGLEDLGDLPDLREVEELLDDPAFDKERAELVLLKNEVPTPSETSDEEGNEEEPS